MRIKLNDKNCRTLKPGDVIQNVLKSSGNYGLFVRTHAAKGGGVDIEVRYPVKQHSVKGATKKRLTRWLAVNCQLVKNVKV